jgi:hypothetical protein
MTGATRATQRNAMTEIATLMLNARAVESLRAARVRPDWEPAPHGFAAEPRYVAARNAQRVSEAILDLQKSRDSGDIPVIVQIETRYETAPEGAPEDRSFPVKFCSIVSGV